MNTRDINLASIKGNRAQQYRGALVRLLRANERVQIAPAGLARNMALQKQSEAEDHARIILLESRAAKVAIPVDETGKPNPNSYFAA